MAIYHFSLKTASRSQGGRAAEHMLYVARSGKYASEQSIAQAEFQYVVREGDYTTRVNELYHVEHHNMPAWAAENPVQFWQAADQFERANGRLYTELEFSLPRELNLDQRLGLAQAFAEKTLGDLHPYTLAVHNSIASDGGEQPHVHLMLTERRLDGIERPADLFFKRANPDFPEQGGAKKERGWSKQEKVQALRESWEKTANAALKRAGFSEQIDHRSLKDRGIHREPQPRIGPRLSKLVKEGKLARDAVIQALLKARRAREVSKTVGQRGGNGDHPTYLKASQVRKEVEKRVEHLEAELSQRMERRNQLGYETTSTLEVVEAQARHTAQEEVGGPAWVEAQGSLRSTAETLQELEIRRSHLKEQYMHQGLARHLPWHRLQYQRECQDWEQAYAATQEEHNRAIYTYESIRDWLAQPAQQQRIEHRVIALVNTYQQQCQERNAIIQQCDLLRSRLTNAQLYSRSLEAFGKAQMPFQQNHLGSWMPARPKAYIHHFTERIQQQRMLSHARERKREKGEHDSND